MENMISACKWDDATFFLFSDNVFDPLIYYSHFSPFVIAFLVGVFVLYADKSNPANRTLSFMMASFCVWVLFDAILWATERPDVVMFIWSIQILFDMLIYLSAVVFLYLFVRRSSPPAWLILVLVLAFAPLLVLSSSRFNLSYFDFTNCDREAAEGILWRYAYFVEAVVVVWILAFGVWNFFREKSMSFRRQIFLLTSGLSFFLLMFSLGNLVGSFTEDWSYGQYGLFGMPVFIGLLAYLIVRYQAFNIKLIATQALVMALAILIGAQLFFVKTSINYVFITSVTFLLAVGFGITLIYSVKNEVRRKEELQDLTNKLSAANVELKRLDKSKTEFISIASHQLRTPLTAIKGFVSLLLEGAYGKVPQETKEVLSKISVANERIIQLVEDLLNISRMETGRLQYEYAEVDIVPLLGELRDAFSVSAKKRGLSLIFDEYCGDVPLLVWIDRRKSFEVISNLIDNAIKYTPSGSVHVQAEKTGDFVRISVRDTGLGISQDTMAHLFLKFSRGEGGRKMFANGTGLGLYVGKNLVEAQGGRIWAESEGPGKGSTFFVEFPMKQKREFSGEQRVKTSLKGSEHE